MLLIDQIVSLDLAKKLKSLGLKQESLFYWYQPLGQDWLIHYIDYNHATIDRKICLERNSEAVSAFTVAELGLFLKDVKIPNGTFIDKKCYQCLELKISLKECTLFHYYEAGFSLGEKLTKSFSDANEANQRAKMLIFLIENKLIDLSKMEKNE